MSWIIRTLLNNKETIKENSYNSGDVGDDFDDLVLIERAIKKLRSLNLISEDDIMLLDSSYKIGKTKSQKGLIEKKKSKIYERVAYYLGGYFTDEGYINYLSDKYNLTEDQIEIARLYIKSELKNKILSKGFKTGKFYD